MDVFVNCMPHSKIDIAKLGKLRVVISYVYLLDEHLCFLYGGTTYS